MALKQSNLDLGNPVYPTSTAGNGLFDGQPEDEDGRDSLKLFRCKQCGFPNDAKRVQNSGGDADGFGNIVHTVTDGVGDFSIRSGCAFCGSLNNRDDA